VNVRLLFLAILLSIGLLYVACGQPADKASLKAAAAEKKTIAEPKKTVRVKHLSGEVLAVNPKARTITLRVREEEIELRFDDSTVVKIDLDSVKPHEIPPGARAAVKYVERKGHYVARGVFISTETAEKKEAPPQSSFRSSA
jgi:ABC-type Fe3+-hydroxamate transport system substrate-binding protein